MELLAYIQEEFIYSDEAIGLAIASHSQITFQTWLKNLTTKSAKLSLNVILASATIFVGLGTTLTAIAEPETSPNVRYVQSLLIKNGFDIGAIDGVAGASTKNAIIRAQKSLGLTADGVAGRDTIAALEDSVSSPSATKESITSSAASPSSTVMNLQKLLADRGFYNGVVDGVMGSQTRNAILAAQKAYKLTPDGVAGAQTLAALESDGNKVSVTPIAATNATKSSEIANLQELLSKRGFYNGAIDGIMGPQSRLAIVAAQKNYGLVTDGIAGSQTIAALESGTRKVSIVDKNIADKNREPAASKTTTAATESKTSDKDVLALQQLLTNRGFYDGAIDGIKGNQTKMAIVAAQNAYGLAPDGVAGVQTMSALQRGTRLEPSATLKPINTPNQPAKVAAPIAKSPVNDDDVANLQNLLADRGFYKGQVTGVLGPITKEAIVSAQKAYGLTPDGVAGSRTIAALEAGAPTNRQQITVKTVSPPVTPPVRVAPQVIPQVTPQPQLQPQIRVQQPQAAVSQPKATLPTTSQAAIQTPPKVQETPQPSTASQPKPPTASSANDVQVLELQRLLTQRGFYSGKADGVLTAETRNSIVRAQNFYIISPADGSPSNKLIDSLSKDQFISADGN